MKFALIPTACLLGCLALPGCKSIGKFSPSSFNPSGLFSGGKGGTAAGFLEECAKLGEKGGVVTGTKTWMFKAEELTKLSKCAQTNEATANRIVQVAKDYQKQLQEKKVKLVMAFVPPKALVYSDMVSKKVSPPKSGKLPLRVDAHVEAVAEKLDAAGLEVVDLTQDFILNRQGLFTPGGSTLTPEATKVAADRIGRAVGMKGTVSLVAKDDVVEGGNELGGKVEKLPVRQIFDKTGVGPVPLASGGSPVVMLCDTVGTTWARERASLAEQLSYELQSPVTLLDSAEARNAPRQRIMRESATARNPLRNAKCVVWVMDSTTLLSADWNMIPLTLEFRAMEPGVLTN
jgi:hypothetical protein